MPFRSSTLSCLQEGSEEKNPAILRGKGSLSRWQTMKISPLKNFDFAEKWHTPPNLCQFQCPHHNKTCFFGHPMDYPMPYFWTDPFSENKSHRLASFQNLVSDWVDLASINAMRSGWGLRPKPQVPNPTLCWVANSRVSPRKVPFRFIQVVFMLPSLNFANKFGSSPIEKFWYSISYQLSFSQIFWMKTHTNYPIYPDLSRSPFRPPVFAPCPWLSVFVSTLRIQVSIKNLGTERLSVVPCALWWHTASPTVFRM